MKRLHVAAATAGVFSMLAIDGANAGVRYFWENLTPDTITGATLPGVIEFDPEFWGLGQHFFGEVDNFDELVSMYFGVEMASIGPGGLPMEARPCEEVLDPATCTANDLEQVFFGAANGTLFDVQFVGTNLIGTILYGSLSDFVAMTGGPIWTVTEFSSDTGAGCSGLCNGLTGRWVLDRSSIPEPGSLTLLSLGLLGLGLTRQRRAN
jgi:PEP-CTERM motif